MNRKDMVLIVEDDASIKDYISILLNSNGYDTMTASGGSEALALIRSRRPDIIVLDLVLPDMDGMEILKEVRSQSNLPIIVVSARTRERDKVTALELGADDYLDKPFGANELLARIRTALRHTRSSTEKEEIAQSGKLTIGEMVIDYGKHHVYMNGRDTHLTLNEYKMVALLGKYAGKVLTYDFIIREIWGPRATADNRVLRVNMAHIRRKIEKNPAVPAYLFTEIGVGYRLRDADEERD